MPKRKVFKDSDSDDNAEDVESLDENSPAPSDADGKY